MEYIISNIVVYDLAELPEMGSHFDLVTDLIDRVTVNNGHRDLRTRDLKTWYSRT